MGTGESVVVVGAAVVAALAVRFYVTRNGLPEFHASHTSYTSYTFLHAFIHHIHFYMHHMTPLESLTCCRCFKVESKI